MSAPTLALRTPCCDRAVRPGPLMRVAVEFCSRTCPACRARYSVRLDPIVVRPEIAAHEVVWTRS